jgi:hypothetical protein
MWGGGRGGTLSSPFGALMSPKKEGCAQRPGAHASPKPTSCLYLLILTPRILQKITSITAGKCHH